ncbi:hypothetical protein HK098_001198 [Nowakowskiella sp. JEL0407]|nr:hypothetical protein HK098_001198 [Nowakowskiella sp. JEL0407]
MTDNFSLLPGLEDSFEPFYPGLDLSENKIANSETEKLEIVNPTHDVDNKTSEDPLDNISLAVLQANFEQRSRFKSNHSANSNTTQINSPPYTLPRQYAGESSSSAPSRSGTLGSRPTNKSISSSSSSESIKTLSEKLSDVPSMSTDTKSEEFAEGFKIEPMRPNADARKSSKKSKERERRPLPTNLTNALIRVSSSRSAPVLDTVSSNISTNDLVLTSQSDLDNDITMHTAYTMKRYEGGGVVLTDRLPGADSSGTEPVSVFVKGGYKVSDHFLQREDVSKKT